jgi:hypothetical protein
MLADVEPWIAEVEKQLFPVLRGDARLKDAETLIGRFTSDVQRWRTGGQVRALVEDANELAAAAAVLKLDNRDVSIFYEPRLVNTPKTIDFLLRWPDGTRSWVDVKTVAPGWTDDDASWARFKKIAAEFPENSNLIVSRTWAGAAISGQEIKARWSFIQRAVEVEQKIALLSDDERGPVRLLLCSNGAFHKDGLEDFADFYMRGRFREDDWSRNAVARYMQDENITFARTLAGFCFLERRWNGAFAGEIEIDVRGPALGS